MKKMILNKKVSLVIAIAFCILMPTMGYIKIGLAPMIIIGGSAIVGFLFWFFTYLKDPPETKLVLTLFLLVVAGLQMHIIEEYLTGFAPAMSRLFDIPWTEKDFVLVFALIGPVVYTLTALGLYYKVPLAGFFAWFIFIGPGVAECSHFIFPLIQPHLEAGNLNSITQTIDGTLVQNMKNYYYQATGHYYFAGMYTAILPMIPGIYAIYRLTRKKRPSNKPSYVRQPKSA